MRNDDKASLFDSDVPLVLRRRESYGLDYANILSTEIELYGNTGLIDCKNPKIVFTIKDYPEKFLRYEIIKDMGGGGNGLFNKNALEKINKLCPNDIQAFNVTIINDPKLKKSFENNDYYLFNVVHRIDALDEEKSEIENIDIGGGKYYPRITKYVYKNDFWAKHLIVKDQTYGTTLWHPRLAREFKTAKGIKFITAEGGIDAE